MTNPLRDQLQAALGGTHTVDRELGGGGMSHVFLATERRFGRSVVVKVLPPDVTGSLSAERFEREMQVAARLQHPHFVPLLTAGEGNGLVCSRWTVGDHAPLDCLHRRACRASIRPRAVQLRLDAPSRRARSRPDHRRRDSAKRDCRPPVPARLCVFVFQVGAGHGSAAQTDGDIADVGRK